MNQFILYAYVWNFDNKYVAFVVLNNLSQFH